MEKTIGEKLNGLRIRAGLSLAEVAAGAGYKTPSGVQQFFSPHYDPGSLAVKVAHKLAPVLAGRGEPVISEHEVYDLTMLPTPSIMTIKPVQEVETAPQTPTLKGALKDVPVYSSALAADIEFDEAGNGLKPVEQTVFEMGEVVTHVRRPPGLLATKVYALFVSGSSMEPRYRPGDPVFVDPQRPPSIGDDVIVQLFSADTDNEEVVSGLIKTLVRRTGSYLELEQYQPHITFRVPMQRVAQIHRVIPWREAFGM